MFDPLQALRRAALVGLEPHAVAPRRLKRRARVNELPEIPMDGGRPAREALTFAMWEDAEWHWRRARQLWAPTLRGLLAQGVAEVELRGDALRVTVRNAVHRGVGVPTLWRPVIVCALTGRELPAVRRALAAGVTRFTAEAPCQSP